MNMSQQFAVAAKGPTSPLAVSAREDPGGQGKKSILLYSVLVRRSGGTPT